MEPQSYLLTDGDNTIGRIMLLFPNRYGMLVQVRYCSPSFERPARVQTVFHAKPGHSCRNTNLWPSVGFIAWRVVVKHWNYTCDPLAVSSADSHVDLAQAVEYHATSHMTHY